MSDTSLRPRAATELVDAAVQLMRRHYTSFILVSAIGVAPWLLLQPVLQAAVTPDSIGAGGGSLAIGLVAMLLIPALTGIWYSLAGAAIIAVASQAYIDGHVDIGAAVQRVTSRIGAVIYGAIAKGVAVMIGLFLLLIGAAYFYTSYFAVPTAIIVEQKTGSEGITRSYELAKGNRWHIFKAMAISFLIYFVTVVGVVALAAVFGIDDNSVVANLISAAFQILLWPLVPITEMMVYYDLRIRNEGFDVEMMASQLGATAAR